MAPVDPSDPPSVVDATPVTDRRVVRSCPGSTRRRLGRLDVALAAA